MDYQNPGFQWAKLILGILMLLGVGLIGYKVVAPTSKDNYAAGSLPSSYETKNYGLVQIGGCATTRSSVSKTKATK